MLQNPRQIHEVRTMSNIVIVLFGAVMFVAGIYTGKPEGKINEEDACQERCAKGRCPKNEIIKRKNLN